jgi:hypothetical protein
MTYLLSVFNRREHADQLRSEVLQKSGCGKVDASCEAAKSYCCLSECPFRFPLAPASDQYVR